VLFRAHLAVDDAAQLVSGQGFSREKLLGGAAKRCG
jgi:hypothetical protein